MTFDTDEYNDTYKIHINVGCDPYDRLKRFIRRGLSALLYDEYFLLLYLPENEGRMQVIRPASDSYHRKRMIKRINEATGVPSCYHALSHLWGLTKDNRYLWDEIGDYVDDEEGQPMKPISMRPEKRDALLALLKDYPDSYWWIDVLCARTDTPLDIMGDIYACGLECIAMIDCKPSLISEIRTVSDAVEDVMKTRSPFRSTWPQYQQICHTNGPKLIELMHTFLQSQWWQRVWTWQEMALPMGEVHLMAETGIGQLQNSTITLSAILGFRGVLQTYKTFRRDIVHENNGHTTLYEVRRRLLDIYYARVSNFRRTRARNEEWGSVIYSLMSSKRQCYDPCDYVYGVLGMFQIKIPRMTDPNAVWRHFLSEMDNLSPPFYGRWMDLADRIDLREVQDIGDVYKKLNEINPSGVLPTW